eukprot:102151_1
MELTNTTPLDIAKQQADYLISCINPPYHTHRSTAKPTTFDMNFHKHTVAPPLINTYNPHKYHRAPHNNNRQPFTPLQTQPRNSAASAGRQPFTPLQTQPRNKYNVPRGERQQFNSLQSQSRKPVPYAFNNPRYSHKDNGSPRDNNKRKQSTPSQTLPEKPSIFDMIKRKTSSHK